VDVADAVHPVVVEDLGAVVEELAEPAEAPKSSLKNIVMKVSSLLAPRRTCWSPVT
jgi:hypothetical protein